MSNPFLNLHSCDLDDQASNRCDAPFFVWFQHRSGSTHLMSLLDSHPEVSSWGEFFYHGEAAATEDVFTRSQQTSTQDFLSAFYSFQWDDQGANLCVDNPSQPRPKAIGFKLKYQQAEAYPNVLDELEQVEGIKAVHLVRRNLLATLVSAQMIPRLLKQFRRPNILDSEKSKKIDRRVSLNLRKLVSDLDRLREQVDRGREAMRAFDSIEVCYEDLVDATDATCHKILRFMKIDASPNLTSRFRKIMPIDFRQSIKNFDKVESALRGTSHAEYLDVG